MMSHDPVNDLHDTVHNNRIFVVWSAEVNRDGRNWWRRRIVHSFLAVVEFGWGIVSCHTEPLDKDDVSSSTTAMATTSTTTHLEGCRRSLCNSLDLSNSRVLVNIVLLLLIIIFIQEIWCISDPFKVLICLSACPNRCCNGLISLVGCLAAKNGL
jgi:hypothetical protein